MDLTQHFPCSPKNKISGLVHIPRMVDKAKAFQKGTLDQYLFPCPLDEIILNFLGVSSDEFIHVMETSSGFETWVDFQCKGKSIEKKEKINQMILDKKPATEEKKQKFIGLRNKIDSSRSDIKTWVDLIDLEEGRF